MTWDPVDSSTLSKNPLRHGKRSGQEVKVVVGPAVLSIAALESACITTCPSLWEVWARAPMIVIVSALSYEASVTLIDVVTPLVAKAGVYSVDYRID